MGSRIRYFLRHPRLALRLLALLIAYAATRIVALATESRAARAFWSALVVPVGVGLIVMGGVLRSAEDPGLEENLARPSVFDDIQLPVRPVGATFDYEQHLGYQVPLTFFIDAVEGDIASATLTLEARMLQPPGQLAGTEAIAIDGIVSGRPHPGFLRRDRIRSDIQATNRSFLGALRACCTERWGTLTVDLAALVLGSGVPLKELLEDGRLDVVIADDTEINSAQLEVCATRHGLTHCHRAWIGPKFSFGSR